MLSGGGVVLAMCLHAFLAIDGREASERSVHLREMVPVNPVAVETAAPPVGDSVTLAQVR